MKYQNIMLAVDLTSDSKELVKRAEEIAMLHQAKLNLIHIDPNFLDTYDGVIDINTDEFQDRVHHESVVEIKNMLAESNVMVDKYLVSTGAIEDEIIQAVSAYNIDLVMMGHHKSSLLRQVLLSPSEPLVREMPCDLLFIKL